MNNRIDSVKNAMLAVQRFPWEQGVCAQALLEAGDVHAAAAMAHDAVLRQTKDGRLAVINANFAVTDPAANGEAVWRAYELTGRAFYRQGAEKMLGYLLNDAPRTDRGIICHNEISFQEGFSPQQVWVDSIYMAPPFLAVMGKHDEALRQIEGYIEYLRDAQTGLLFHIYDPGTERFVRRKLWATGNGWALMGIGRVIDSCLEAGRNDIAGKLMTTGRDILDAMLKYQLPDGRFRDILDDEESFAEGTGAMMMSAFVYRGIAGGWLDECYAQYADAVVGTMDRYIDEFGIIHDVCGCPHFVDSGTSAESMAAYIMMHAQRERCTEKSRASEEILSIEQIRLYEELSFNSHPALETEHYDGWLLRYAGGYTGRANSVSMIYPSCIDINEKVEECERRYRHHGLPCIFKLTDASDALLDGLLERRGYELVTPTYLMTTDMRGKRFERCRDAIITECADNEWLSAYFGNEDFASSPETETARRMFDMINVPARYCRIERDGKTVARASAVIERGYMTLLNVFVSEKLRGKGLGKQLCLTLMDEAVSLGAHTACLQVIKNNEAAVRLYEKLGYKPLYSYWYRRKQ